MREYTLREYLAGSFNLLPTAIADSFTSVLFGRLLTVAARTGMFELLKTGAASTEQLSASLHFPSSSLDVMAQALTAQGYLRMRKDRYTLTPQARKWLVKSSPHYLGHFLEYVEILYGHWATLEDGLRRGKPLHSYIELFTESEWRTYTLGMMDLARLIAPRVLRHVYIPQGASTVLDAAGSHGAYTIELLRRRPGLSGVIADLPQVTAITKEILEAEGVADRCSVLPCDVTKTDFGTEGYDIVLAFNIVHGFPPDVNKAFIASLARALRPGGSIALLDQLTGDRRWGVAVLLPLMVGVNLINEIGGRAYSFPEVRSWLVSAGLTRIQMKRIGLPGVHLVRARKG